MVMQFWPQNALYVYLSYTIINKYCILYYFTHKKRAPQWTIVYIMGVTFVDAEVVDVDAANAEISGVEDICAEVIGT